jgi:hypothetical protein
MLGFMNIRILKRLVAWWIAPALIGVGLAMISFWAAVWDCQIPGCTHWFREALAFAAHCGITIGMETFGSLLGFEGAAFFALAVTPMLVAVAGISVAWVVRRFSREPESLSI